MQETQVNLDSLDRRTEEFERLGSMMGRLRMLRQEKSEILENMTKAEERLGYLDIDIQKQAKTVERQLLLIERTSNG